MKFSTWSKGAQRPEAQTAPKKITSPEEHHRYLLRQISLRQTTYLTREEVVEREQLTKVIDEYESNA